MIGILQEVRDEQLGCWPMARENYSRLGLTVRKPFLLGGLRGAFQFNPGRIVSTGAVIDKKSIEERPCFLCPSNRPKEQLSEEIIDGWEFLINPYPIFPLHFTIAASEHVPQDRIPLEMASMAEKLPGMCVFFNGARAGASAPDHKHCQAVMASELPLLNFLEKGGNPEELPFEVAYEIITPDDSGMRALQTIVSTEGRDSLTGVTDYRLINAYFWIGGDGLLRVAVVPRSAHRPLCYPSGSNDEKDSLMVSPGAIDMAGIVVLPREEDFQRITESDLEKIYAQTAVRKKIKSC